MRLLIVLAVLAAIEVRVIAAGFVRYPSVPRGALPVVSATTRHTTTPPRCTSSRSTTTLPRSTPPRSTLPVNATQEGDTAGNHKTRKKWQRTMREFNRIKVVVRTYTHWCLYA